LLGQTIPVEYPWQFTNQQTEGKVEDQEIPHLVKGYSNLIAPTPQPMVHFGEYYQDLVGEGPSNSNDMYLIFYNKIDVNLLESSSSWYCFPRRGLGG